MKLNINMKKNSLIRTIYLYTFACLGLVLLTVGSVGFLNMGLKAYVFTKAEDEEKMYRVSVPIKGSAEEQELPEVNYVVSKRHKDAAMNLSLILIGLPLYLYHWTLIKKETKQKELQQS